MLTDEQVEELQQKLTSIEGDQEVLKATCDAFVAKVNRSVGDFASEKDLPKKLVGIGDNLFDAVFKLDGKINELRKLMSGLYIKTYQDVQISKGQSTEEFHLTAFPVEGTPINMYVNGLRYFQGKEFTYDANKNVVKWNNQATSLSDPGNLGSKEKPWEIANNSLVVFEYQIKTVMPWDPKSTADT